MLTMLTKLMLHVQSALDLEFEATTLWTDSTIVLDWLSSHPRKWPTFIANRTSEILSHYNRDHWKHVPSADNPADCASRGLSAMELLENKQWWDGPQWWSKHPKIWPPQLTSYGTNEETKVETLSFKISVGNCLVQDIINRYNSFYKMAKVLALSIRFTRNCRVPITQRKLGPLLPSDVEEASSIIIRFQQAISFSDELQNLTRKLPIAKSSKLKTLNPFIDTEGVLRVGGRLKNSVAPYNTRHPIILCHKSQITKIIARDYHKRFYHAGINLTSNLMRSKYWIIYVCQRGSSSNCTQVCKLY